MRPCRKSFFCSKPIKGAKKGDALSKPVQIGTSKGKPDIEARIVPMQLLNKEIAAICLKEK